jgi:putative nucleotidyltransferase with HDIG domain
VPRQDLNRALQRLDSELPAVLRAVAASAPEPVWAVGGFVRDVLLKRRPYDLDVAVAGDAQARAGSIKAALGGHAFPLDEERGTFRVALSPESPVSTIDVATLRGADIEADLGERDFTANALAAPISEGGLGPLVDLFDGQGDLKRRVVRMVSERALADDPLRLLRAVRLAVELDFDVEEATAGAVRRLAPRVAEPAGERVRDEVMRIMASGQAARGVRLLDHLALLEVLLPELTRAKGVAQPERFHHYDVFDHCVEALAVMDWLTGPAQPAGRTPRNMREAYGGALSEFGLRGYFEAAVGGQTRLALTKLATLLHDVAKPETKAADEEGRVRFLGHSEAGAKVARAVCRRLRMGNRETRFVALLVEEHLRPAQLSQSGAPTDRAIFRFFRDLGDAAPACLVLSLADGAAAAGPRLTLSRWQGHLAYIRYVLERARGQSQAAGGAGERGKRHFIPGDRLIRALALEPGPEVGRLLLAIDEAVATGDVKSEEEAIDLARDLHNQGPAGGPTKGRV